ncbi:MAG: hypothetical protein HKL91_09610, partial [Candidatus Eremiobacteraeota bacterium]|nr:hypothetical protein [Candidatus Eremiobacteraeota bacterium]
TTHTQTERRVADRIRDVKEEISSLIDDAARLTHEVGVAMADDNEKRAQALIAQREASDRRRSTLQVLLVELERRLPAEQLAEARVALQVAIDETARANERYLAACSSEREIRVELTQAERETNDATRQRDVAHSREMGARRLVATMEAQNANP